MKKFWLTLIVQYSILVLLIFLFFGCATIPTYTARVELNECDSTVVPSVHQYLEISFDGKNVELSSGSICFSLYLFNADRDTLFVRDFEGLNESRYKFELIK